jgi:ubiquinone/menaquinone biosynthesis C-methylase UbiE
MKLGFKLSNIELGEVKIGGVEVNTEFSISEMVAMRKEAEVMLEKMPVYLEQVAKTVLTYEDLDNQIREIDREEALESMIKEITHNAKLRAIKELFAQG